jgi:hypothetical protein
MKTIAISLLAAIGLVACSGQSDAPPPAPPAAKAPAAAPAATPAAADPAKAEIIKRAEALTEQQIEESRDLPSLAKLMQVYTEIKDTPRLTWTLETLTHLLPNAGDLQVRLAATYASADDRSHVYDLLLKMINQGYSYDLSKDPEFANARGTKVWDYIVESFDRNAKPFGEGKVAFELPKGDKLYESMGWDPKRKQFLVGSVRDGSVELSDDKGKLSNFIKADAQNGLMAVFGLAVDSAHDRLYVISNGVPHFQGFNADMAGKAVLFEFALSSSKLVKKYTPPEDTKAHIFSSIAIDGKGGVYVADGVNEQIFRLDSGSLKLMLGNPTLSGIRGMTVTPDGKTMYFSDVALGIFGVDLTKSAPFNLSHNTQKLVLGGIDSLYWYDGTLIAVQSNMKPQRVMRLKLSEDGRAIASAAPLDAAQPAFNTPTGGVVVGSDLYFIANSEKNLYSSLGVLDDASALEPIRVFRSNLRYAWNAKAPGPPAPPLPQPGKNGAKPGASPAQPPDGAATPAEKSSSAQH